MKTPSKNTRPAARRITRIVCAASIAAFCTARGAIVTATWSNATSGNWNVNSNWTNTPASGGFPNNGNGGVATYDAVVNKTGAAYTVNLGTSTTVDNLSVASANATVNHTAGVFHTNGALTVSAGTFRLNGGEISNTNIVMSGGTFAFTSAGGILSNGTVLNGNLNLSAGNANVRLQSGAGFTGVANVSGTSAYLAIEDTRTLTGKTINLDGPGYLTIEGSNTLTLGAGTLVRGSGGIGNQFVLGGTNGLINQAGTIRADLAGQTLTIIGSSFTNQAGGLAEAINGGRLDISATNWSNAGQIKATGGSTVDFNGAWSNAGGTATVDATSTLNLNGTSTIGSLGTINNSAGGTVNIIGTINNTGTNLAFSATTGSWQLQGGTISGGQVTPGGGQTLLFTSAGGILSNGTVLNGNLNLSAPSANVRLQSGAGFTGVANVTGTSAYLAIEDTRTLTGKTINLDGPGYLTIEGSNTLTLGAGTLVRGSGGIGNQFVLGGTNGLINQAGTIRADLAGQTLTIIGSSFTNQAGGLAEAINGGRLDISATNWSNAGQIKATGGSTVDFNGAWSNAGGTATVDATSTLNLNGTSTIGSLGTINNSAGGTVNIIGTINNTGTNLAFSATTGSWQLQGGTINGGQVTPGGGQTLLFTSAGGILSNGTVLNGNLNLSAPSANVRLQSGAGFTGVANVSGTSAYLAIEDTRTLTGKTINLDGPGYLTIEGSNTLTLGAGTLVRGSGGIGNQFVLGGTNGLINQAGTIRADLAGQTLTIIGSSFTNQGGVVEAISGSTLTVPNGYTQTAGTTRVANGSTISMDAGKSLTISGGLMGGNGTIDGKVSNAGTIAPGLSAGTLAISGDLTLSASSVLQIELGGRTAGTQYDRLTEGGTARLTLAGTLEVRFINTFQNSVLPTDVFTIIASNQAPLGTFANVTGGRVTTADSLGSFAVTVVGNNVQLGSFQAVPEPSSAVMLAAGSLLFGLRRRRAARGPRR